MNYASLKTNIADICETTFTDDQLAMFTQQAEEKILLAVDIPALRKLDDGPLSGTNKLYTLPTDYLYTYSIAIVNSSTHTFLLNKDVNFIREAYPIPATTGLPKHYAYFSQTSFLLGPTPTNIYDVELHYGYYPESIVTAGTTWLGDEFDSALLNGALIEAIRFMKGEPDLVQFYERLYVQSLKLLKTLGDGKLREDTYRSGQFRMKVE